MICHHCAVAGFMNAEASEAQSAGEADSIRALARGWHRRCDRRDCTCQHVLGDVVNHVTADDGVIDVQGTEVR